MPASAGGSAAHATGVTRSGSPTRALLALRVGRDRGYWRTVRAGAGPFVALTYRNLGGGDVLGVAIGGELWGGN